MKEIVKHIIVGIVVALVSVYLIAAAVWFSSRPKTTPCSAIEWDIRDLADCQYVTEEELNTLIRHTNLNPENLPQEQVLTQAIEACVQSHPMVRQAQCYITRQGRVIVRLTQRQPLMGVRTESASYYIDSDRLRMPLHSHEKADVIWAIGNVEEDLAKKELADIVVWLQDQTRWEDRFERIDVQDKNNITLVDTTGLKIRIGDGSQFESKMHKLHVFETQMAKVEGKEYKELDLRYKNQVIGKE